MIRLKINRLTYGNPVNIFFENLKILSISLSNITINVNVLLDMSAISN